MNYKGKLLLVILILICSFTVHTAWCQPPQSISRNSLYVDAASHGAFYSLNYDRVFSSGKLFFKSYRAGFSILENALAIPIGINFFRGKRASHIEYSLTLVPYVESYNKLFSGKNEADKKLYIIPAVGYRYQKSTAGLFFKVAVAPVVLLDPASDNFWKMDGKIYAGITAAAGYSF